MAAIAQPDQGFGGGSHPGGRYPGFVYLRIAGQVPAIETEIWNKSIVLSTICS